MSRKKLRLERDTLTDLDPADLAGMAGGDATQLCYTRNGCPWTGDPCLLTQTPPSYNICS